MDTGNENIEHSWLKAVCPFSSTSWNNSQINISVYGYLFYNSTSHVLQLLYRVIGSSSLCVISLHGQNVGLHRDLV